MRSTSIKHSAVAIACAAVLLAAGNVQAALVLSVSSSTLAANTPDFSNNSNPRSENLSVVSTTNAGGSIDEEIGEFVSGQVRYTSVTSADADAFSGGSISRDATHSYRATLTITPDNAGTVYDLTLNTARLGALVIRNEGGSEGRVRIDAVSGLINGSPDAGLDLAGLPQINSGSTTVQDINQANSLTLTGLTGTQTFDLDFTWATYVYSGNNVISGSDEAVVLLGMEGTLGGIAGADDYPGTANRPNGLAEDGHWLTATVLVTHVVPEPGTFALAGLGLMGLVARRRRSA